MVNVATPGGVIPLKWRVTDAAGVPVTTLSGVTVTSVVGGCSAGRASDTLEPNASATSGLQNMADSYHRFNWKTAKG